MSELFTDFGISTLASSVSIGATSFTVQTGDGAKYPAPTGSDFFRVLLFNRTTVLHEFVVVTDRTGDVFTCAPTTLPFNAGDVAENRPSEAFFNSLTVTDANIQHGNFIHGVDTGATDAYVVAMTPAALLIADGQEVSVDIDNTNSGGTCSLKLDALTAVPIKMEGGGNPPAGSIKSGFIHTFKYDGTNFLLQSSGLALTANGYNADAKKIQNTAAGTASTDVATIGGTETHTNKTFTSPTINNPVVNVIKDVNANNLLEYLKVDDAVNWLRLLNSITGKSLTLSTQGEDDVGLDFLNKAGKGLLKLAAVVDAVNEVTITNAVADGTVGVKATGDSDDVGFDVQSKGTGPVKANGGNLTHKNKPYGGGVHLETLAAADGEVDFNSLITADYSKYLFILENVVPTDNSVSLDLLTSIDNGTSHSNSSGDYASVSAGGVTDSKIQLTAATLSNTISHGGASGEVWLYNPLDTAKYTRVNGDLSIASSSTSVSTQESTGMRRAAEAVNAVRFDFSSSSTFAGGSISMYGFK